jgi:hypothetical protein
MPHVLAGLVAALAATGPKLLLVPSRLPAGSPLAPATIASPIGAECRAQGHGR